MAQTALDHAHYADSAAILAAATVAREAAADTAHAAASPTAPTAPTTTAVATAATADPRLDLEPAERYLAMALRAAKLRCSPHETAITEMHLARLAESRGERDKADALRMRARQAFQRMAMTWHLAQLGQECPRAVAP